MLSAGWQVDLMVIGRICAALLIKDYGQSKRQSCGIRLDWNGSDYLSDALLCASLGCYGYVEVASISIGWVCTVYLVISKLLILIQSIPYVRLYLLLITSHNHHIPTNAFSILSCPIISFLALEVRGGTSCSAHPFNLSPTRISSTTYHPSSQCISSKHQSASPKLELRIVSGSPSQTGTRSIRASLSESLTPL